MTRRICFASIRTLNLRYLYQLNELCSSHLYRPTVQREEADQIEYSREEEPRRVACALADENLSRSRLTDSFTNSSLRQPRQPLPSLPPSHDLCNASQNYYQPDPPVEWA